MKEWKMTYGAINMETKEEHTFETEEDFIEFVAENGTIEDMKSIIKDTNT